MGVWVAFAYVFSEYLGSFNRKAERLVAEKSGSSPGLKLEVRMNPPLHSCSVLSSCQTSGFLHPPQARWQFSIRVLGWREQMMYRNI